MDSPAPQLGALLYPGQMMQAKELTAELFGP